MTLPSRVQYLALASRSDPTLRSGDVALSCHAINNIHGNRVASHTTNDGEPASLSVEQILISLRKRCC